MTDEKVPNENVDRHDHDARMAGVDLNEHSTDPQVIEFEWRYAQGGEHGRGYHKNYDGTPAVPYSITARQAEEQKIMQELKEKGVDPSTVDITQMILMRKYTNGRD
ncbi:MAG: hypothetical protein IKY98_03805 [Alphaproteobacteria bacterium]|nr:hypothetical protein [Alphaproteobacteria bacterium]